MNHFNVSRYDVGQVMATFPLSEEYNSAIPRTVTEIIANLAVK